VSCICSLRKFILFGGITLGIAAAIAQADTFETQLGAIEKRTGGRIGISAYDTGNNKRIEYRPNERFLMCSTFKFLAAAAVLKRVDGGKDDLDRFVRYAEKDILEYAPVTKKHLSEGGMSLGDLCAAAIAQSDNTAGNLLLQVIGGPVGLTAFVRTLEDRTTRLDRIEPELNIATPGDERDTTTPAAMQHDMVLLITGKILSSASRQRLEDWLAKNETGTGMIRAGVPKGWRVGDKTGRGANGATNDIAIIRPPDRSPILLAIYSIGSSAPFDTRNAAVAEVARLIVESL
jgi:beta-lactamase class A